VSTKDNDSSANGSELAENEATETEFDHFADLAKKLLAVPKDETKSKAKRRRVTQP